MEHLAQAIQTNDDIKGLHTNSNRLKMILYADDILLYIFDPMHSIPALMTELERFGNHSHFKINIIKTEALSVNLSMPTMKVLKTLFPFRWNTNSITYLGIKIPTCLPDLYHLNYLPLLHTLRKDLESYRNRPLSSFGRMNTFKMETLPKLLYVFQTVPILPPKFYFCSLQSLMLKFIWPTGFP